MTELVRDSFCIDKECGQFLVDIKRKYKIPKSVIINNLLKYYMENLNDLLKLIIGDNTVGICEE
ncbi:MAG: hypothetical protein ACFFDF_23375 [Candidatus Odinarchaeota archaeon]